MKAFLAGLANWQTTICGILMGISNLVTNAPKLSSGSPSDKANVILLSLGAIITGIFAKDADKTGVLGSKKEDK